MNIKIKLNTSTALQPDTTDLGTHYLSKNKRSFDSYAEAYNFILTPSNPTTRQLNSSLFLNKEIEQYFTVTYKGATSNHKLLIFRGFTYDGASVIPVIRKLFKKVSRLGFLAHDYNYTYNAVYNQLLIDIPEFLDDMEAMPICERVAFQRLVADRYMLANLKYRGVNYFKRYITYYGVRFGARRAFKAHRINNLRP